MKQQMSRAMDMRFYWLRDQVKQKHFHIHWKHSYLNLGDYVTKHHPTKHHQAVRSTYVCNTVLPDAPKPPIALPCKGELKTKPVPAKPLPTNTPAKCHDVINGTLTTTNQNKGTILIRRANKILQNIATKTTITFLD